MPTVAATLGIIIEGIRFCSGVGLRHSLQLPGGLHTLGFFVHRLAEHMHQLYWCSD